VRPSTVSVGERTIYRADHMVGDGHRSLEIGDRHAFNAKQCWEVIEASLRAPTIHDRTATNMNMIMNMTTRRRPG
jgi:hypothetical protein